jgi:hypothetical protein
MLSYEAWMDGRTAVCHNKPVFWRAYKNEWPISWNYEYIIFDQIIFSKLSSLWLRRGCLFAWRTDGHNSGVFRRWMEICKWKHEYKVHRISLKVNAITCVIWGQKPNRLLTKERSRTSETRYHRRTNNWQGYTRTKKKHIYEHDAVSFRDKRGHLGTIPSIITFYICACRRRRL